MFVSQNRLGKWFLGLACPFLTWSADMAPGQEAPPVEIEIVVDGPPAQEAAALPAGGELRHQATAMICIRDDRPYIVAPTPGQENLDRFIRTQVNLLLSRIVLDRVLADPEIAKMDEFKTQSQPLDYLSQHLRVTSIENSELFQVSFIGQTPESAAAIVNAVLDAYLKIQGDLEAHRVMQVVQLLDKEMDRRSREIERKRHALRQLTKMVQASETEGPGGEWRPEAAAVQQMWMQAWREEVELGARLSALEETAVESQVPAAAEVESAVVDDPAVQELSRRLDEAQQELKELAQLKPERAARFEGPIKEKVAKLKAELALKTELTRQWRLSQRGKAAQSQRDAEIAQARLELKTKQHVLARLSALMGEQMAAREKSANRELDAEFLRRDLARAETVYQNIADRAESLATEMRAPARVGEMRRARADEAKLVNVPRGIQGE